MKSQKKLVLVLMIGVLFVASLACTRDVATTGASPAATAEPARKELSSFSQIAGTQILVAVILGGEDLSGLEFSPNSIRDYPVSVHNYIFFDMDSEQFRTLLPTNDYVILNKSGNPYADNATNPVKWWFYSVVKSDTNQDKMLSDKDKFILAMSDIDGQNYVELIPDVDQSLGQFMKSDTLLFYFYKQNGKKYYAKVDLQARKVISTAEYPSFGPDVK